MENSAAQQTVNEILDLFERYGDEEYGENLSQQEHMIQAAQMAQAENQPDEVVIAALLHDIGHLYGHEVDNERMGNFGIMDHEALGADYLRAKGFSDKVAALVKGHVLAKRYLCYTDPEYLKALSHASRETLKQQGGPMMKAEAEHFQNSLYFDLSIRMRLWDEEAKIPNQTLPSIDSFQNMLLQQLA
ncbi:MAG: HD domain-containing protein [Bacteroidia bacterium]